VGVEARGRQGRIGRTETGEHCRHLLHQFHLLPALDAFSQVRLDSDSIRPSEAPPGNLQARLGLLECIVIFSLKKYQTGKNYPKRNLSAVL